MGFSLLLTKLLTIFGMLLVGLLPGLVPVLVPLWFQKKRTENATSKKSQHQMHLSDRSKKFVSALACFGAGVFIATFFLDMLGEVRTAWKEWFEAGGIQSSYPWPELFAILGFLLVMMVEQITMFCHSRRQARSSKHHHEQLFGVQHVNNDEHSLQKATYPVALPDQPVDFYPMQQKTAEPAYEGACCDADQAQTAPHDVNIADIHMQPFSEVKVVEDHANLKSIMRALILLLALCFHSLFEGMAIGLMKNQAETLTLFFSVCMHKGVVAFCLGLNIAQSGLRPIWVTVFIVLFASMSPLGIALGLAISHAPATLTRYAVIAVLQGISSGTFLYVTFIEILPKELLKDEMAHGGGDHHDHSNIFLEDMQHTASKGTAITGCNEASALNHRCRSSSRDEHGVSAAAEFSQQADKLVKCIVFSAGVAVMAFAIGLTGGH